jgi:hypothetical protein
MCAISAVLCRDGFCHLQVLSSAKSVRAGRGGSAPLLKLGVAAIDSALGGGLALGALHEVGPAQPVHLGAAASLASDSLLDSGVTFGILFPKQCNRHLKPKCDSPA